jgi:hypothetical protein
MNEKSTVSPCLGFASLRKETPNLTSRSSPTPSTYSSAPCSFQIFRLSERCCDTPSGSFQEQPIQIHQHISYVVLVRFDFNYAESRCTETRVVILYPTYLPHELLTRSKQTRISDPLSDVPQLRGTMRARLLDVDHPGNAKAIDAHAEACGPERRLIRHLDLSVF